MIWRGEPLLRSHSQPTSPNCAPTNLHNTRSMKKRRRTRKGPAPRPPSPWIHFIIIIPKSNINIMGRNLCFHSHSGHWFPNNGSGGKDVVQANLDTSFGSLLEDRRGGQKSNPKKVQKKKNQTLSDAPGRIISKTIFTASSMDTFVISSLQTILPGRRKIIIKLLEEETFFLTTHKPSNKKNLIINEQCEGGKRDINSVVTKKCIIGPSLVFKVSVLSKKRMAIIASKEIKGVGNSYLNRKYKKWMSMGA